MREDKKVTEKRHCASEKRAAVPFLHARQCSFGDRRGGRLIEYNST